MNTTSFKIAALVVLILGCNQPQHYRDRIQPVPAPERTAPVSVPISNPSWSVHFSPNGGATENLVGAINGAQRSIFVQAYSFTSMPIAEALTAAHKRGVHVEVILDKSDKTGKGSALPMMVNNGLVVYVDSKHAIAHNKIMIIDSNIVFTGSFNFTNAAEHSNAENSLELTDAQLADTYQKNWNNHKDHSDIQH